MARRLHDPKVCAETARRIGLVTPETTARWGSMDAGAMLCHLRDALEVALREREVSPVPIRGRRIVRLLALSRIPFPRSVQAPPEVDPARDGSSPEEFAADRNSLLATLDRYAAQPLDGPAFDHPILGPFTPAQWSFFQWKHCDHHLRQFGV